MPLYPPGPRGLPWVGQSLAYMRDPLKFIEGCVRQHGVWVTIKKRR
jgi:hypothetical protein